MKKLKWNFVRRDAPVPVTLETPKPLSPRAQAALEEHYREHPERRHGPVRVLSRAEIKRLYPGAAVSK